MRAYKTSVPNRQWQSDLVDMQGLKKFNSGYSYILTAIDVFSRYAWAVPLKSKSFPNVIEGFKILFKDYKPQLLQTDDGSEFINKNIQQFFNENGIKQFSIKSEFKAAMVERFHRTLRGRMYRNFTKNATKKWVDVLPSLLESYNNAKHSSLQGVSPAHIFHDKERASLLWEMQNVHNAAIIPKFKVGELVRLALTKKQFDHGYTPNWSGEIYQITEIDSRQDPSMYHVKNADSNEIVAGKFYSQNLQKVARSGMINKILDTRVKKGVLHYLVEWKDGDQTWENTIYK